MKTLRISALNIVTHPHSKASYISLLQRAHQLRVAAKYFGNHLGVIGAFNEYYKTGAYMGTIHQFTDVDFQKPWLDLQTGEAASESAVRSITLPSNLKPEFKSTPFVFLPDRHRMFFASEQLGPTSAQKLVSRILSNENVCKGISEIHVNIEQDARSLKELFSIPGLSLIEIRINRPNPDDIGGAESRIMKRLQALHARSMQESFTGSPGETLEPDSEIRDLAKVALSNGRVDVKGRDEDNLVVAKSSIERPLSHRVRFDTSTQTEFDELFSFGQSFEGRTD